ncbi:uncharacterized protein LOC143376538 [Andrena cerasifolii]|uniref:uncharacterized protein LOC143376538 n=1 Tax=Andrena cerasifolii TaxID=2819439 RepID=UPI0040378DCE
MVFNSDCCRKYPSEFKQPREDYREFLELSIIFLNGTVPKFSFRVPGAFHHARWMAKAIYFLKIFLFRDEFVLTKDEENGIRDICIFLIKLYLKAWIHAPVTAKAPRQDFEFLKNLYAYSAINKNVSSAALHKFCNHLWYLTSEAAALAFFESNITHDAKKRMVLALDILNNNDVTKLIISPNNVIQYIDNDNAGFVSQKTLMFFKRFAIPKDFINKDPSELENDPNYNVGLNIVNNLRVVNDSAEQGVKLMQEFNNVLSRNEEEKQIIM